MLEERSKSLPRLIRGTIINWSGVRQNMAASISVKLTALVKRTNSPVQAGSTRKTFDGVLTNSAIFRSIASSEKNLAR